MSFRPREGQPQEGEKQPRSRYRSDGTRRSTKGEIAKRTPYVQFWKDVQARQGNANRGSQAAPILRPGGRDPHVDAARCPEDHVLPRGKGEARGAVRRVAAACYNRAGPTTSQPRPTGSVLERGHRRPQISCRVEESAGNGGERSLFRGCRLG